MLAQYSDEEIEVVLAHEIGHHVQNLLGIMKKTSGARGNSSNTTSVRVELQADCLAGIWANFANRERHILDQGDIEEGLNAAAQIGDDRLQMRSQGYVVPEAFTHGSAEQRVKWFRQGIDSGSLKQCDTFSRSSVS
jgi:predicted metalloprotease